MCVLFAVERLPLVSRAIPHRRLRVVCAHYVKCYRVDPPPSAPAPSRSAVSVDWSCMHVRPAAAPRFHFRPPSSHHLIIILSGVTVGCDLQLLRASWIHLHHGFRDSQLARAHCSKARWPWRVASVRVASFHRKSNPAGVLILQAAAGALQQGSSWPSSYPTGSRWRAPSAAQPVDHHQPPPSTCTYSTGSRATAAS